jgi:hypothetical protein
MRSILIIILVIAFGCSTPKKIAIVKIGGRFGCIDQKGIWLVRPIWDWMRLGEKPGDPILVEKDSLFGYVAQDGQVLITPRFKDASIFYEGLAVVGNGSKKGFIDIKGDTVIPFRFDDVFLGFSNGLSDVQINDSCGYINNRGEVVIPIIFETAYPFLSEYAEVRTFSGETQIIDKTGRSVTDVSTYANKRLWTRSAADYRLIIEGPRGKGWLNDKGDTIVKPVYESVGVFTEKRSIVQMNRKWGVVDDHGKVIVPPKFDQLWHFQEGLANFQKNGKWGFIDKSGKESIPAVFDYASEFNNSLAYVEIDGKAGFIGTDGHFVIKAVFEPERLGGKFR